MKRSLTLFFVLLLGISACKTKNTEEDVDPRDQYVGTYEGGYQSQILLNNYGFNPETGKLNIKVSKASNPKEIYLELVFPAATEKLTAEMDNNKFTVIDKKQESITVLSETVVAKYTATGTFPSAKEITINTVAGGVLGSNEIKRTGSITGTRK